jgi:hypothetical protein
VNYIIRALLLVCGSAALLASCAVAYGPLEQERFEAQMRRDISIPDKQVLFYAAANWYTGADGYRMATIRQTHVGAWRGAIMMGDQSLYFLSWNEKDGKYEEKYRVDYGTIDTVEVRAFGAGRRMVMRTHGATRIESFDIFKDNEAWIDAEKTQRACEVIAGQSHKICQLPSV